MLLEELFGKPKPRVMAAKRKKQKGRDRQSGRPQTPRSSDAVGSTPTRATVKEEKRPVNPAPPPEPPKGGPKLAAVSERAGISMKLAQECLYEVKVVPKTGAWAQKVTVGKKDYVVGMTRMRNIVVVLPLPFIGDDKSHGYNIIKPFVSAEQFLDQLEND